MDERIKEIFTRKLNYYLRLKDRSQADLARAMDVTTSTVSDWCNGKKMPRSDRLQAIANWLNIQLSDLLTEKDDPVQSFEQLLWDNHGVLFRKIGSLSEDDQQLVEAFVERLTNSGE